MSKSDKMFEKLVAYCSLYCPKCYKMTISEAAAKLKKELENPHVCGKIHFLQKSFLTNLDQIIALRCTKICKYIKERNNKLIKNSLCQMIRRGMPRIILG